jgi:hypothetical protein
MKRKNRIYREGKERFVFACHNGSHDIKMHRITVKRPTLDLLMKSTMFGRFRKGSYEMSGDLVSFEVDQKVFDALQAECIRTGASMDDVIIKAIEKYYKDQSNA